MNGPMILTFAILTITIVLFIIDKLRIDIVAMLAMLALLALVLTGLINTDQALAGFANSTVITIADNLFTHKFIGGTSDLVVIDL